MAASSIKYLRRREIDIARYDRCIDESANGLIYAYSFYLDHMGRHWDALVWNDYEAVMPLTWNRKFGIHYLYQPAFTASLGVFGKSLNKEMVSAMLDAIPSKFRLIEIELNYQNCFAKSGSVTLKERTNFVLDLSKPYENIHANYRENLQRNIKRSAGATYKKDIPLDEVLKLAHMQQASYYTPRDFENFHALFNHLHSKKQAVTRGVYSSSNELLASAVFFFSHNRAYYILVGNKPEGTEGASHFLIDKFIQEHAGKNMLLDFEGSDIKGLAYFYSSFGAVEEKYCSARANHLPSIVKWLKSKI